MSFIKKRRKGDIVLFQVESKRLDESAPIRGKLRRINPPHGWQMNIEEPTGTC